MRQQKAYPQTYWRGLERHQIQDARREAVQAHALLARRGLQIFHGQVLLVQLLLIRAVGRVALGERVLGLDTERGRRKAESIG